MYVVTVHFELDPMVVEQFIAAILENAEASRTLEAGCRQFDVCVAEDCSAKVFLYEVYDNRAAFDAHLASAHFRQFDSAVRSWIIDKRISTYRRVTP